LPGGGSPLCPLSITPVDIGMGAGGGQCAVLNTLVSSALLHCCPCHTQIKMSTTNFELHPEPPPESVKRRALSLYRGVDILKMYILCSTEHLQIVLHVAWKLIIKLLNIFPQILTTIFIFI